MIRWLKVLRAEFLRDFTLALRYPVELFAGMFILYLLFMGLFLGAKVLAGSNAIAGNLDALVIGYTMWYFAIIAINRMSVDIESEARQGTLEQVYLHAPSYLGLLWIRAATHIVLGGGAVLLLSLLIQATTRHFLQLTWGIIPPLFFVMVLTIAGLCGFGLILGGFSLVFKRIGQLAAIVQFSLFFLAYTDLSLIPEPWRGIVSHLPMGRGVDILKSLIAEQGVSSAIASSIAWLAADSLIYVAVGSMLFLSMERIARKGGLLSHY
ncbi:hypothetical protein IIA79_05930 [bacterium]|nr:hypothetical protein [bacterium]